MKLDAARARKLRRLRTQLGWSYKRTADAIGCDERLIRGWEAAAYEPAARSRNGARDAPDWFMAQLEAYAAHIREAPTFSQLHEKRDAA